MHRGAQTRLRKSEEGIKEGKSVKSHKERGSNSSSEGSIRVCEDRPRQKLLLKAVPTTSYKKGEAELSIGRASNCGA